MVQVIHAKAIFDCVGDEESELSFNEGDLLIDVRETSEEGWLHGRLERTGDEGLFPDNYVELIHVQVQQKGNGLPQLPMRSSTATKNASPMPATSPQPEAAPEQSNSTTSAKPLLPARKVQASPIATTGLRKVETSIIPGGGEKVGAAATTSSRVALPGLGPRSMNSATRPNTAFPQIKDTPDPGKALSGPPALPRRSNTVYENIGSANEQSSASGPALSVRERMANLSMANQRQTSSSSASIPVSQPAILPAGPPAKETDNIGAAARSPLSSALRPTLPPRAPTESPAKSPSPPNPSTSAKHVYQVQDAAVPVPKLTTFSRPRSARTAKSPGSSEPTSPALGGLQPETVSTPPKLPSRTPSVASTMPSVIKPVDTPSSAESARFSPAAVKQSPVDFGALPTISRNNQPLPLPSRHTLNPSTPTSPAANTAAGLSRSTTTTPAGGLRHAGLLSEMNNHGASETSDIPAGAAFGVKLSSVGSKTPKDTRTVSSLSAPPTATLSAMETTTNTAPPLPARSPSTPSTTTERATTPTMTPKRETASRPFSPAFSPSSAQVNRSKTLDSQANDMARRWSGLLSSPARTPSGKRVAILPPRLPDVAAPGSVGVKADARRRYETLFKSVCSGDYIDGAKVHAIYVRSRLDSKTLAQIWDLVDVDNAGRLSKAQFCMGLYLIDERLATGLIPLEVSDELWVSVME